MVLLGAAVHEQPFDAGTQAHILSSALESLGSASSQQQASPVRNGAGGALTYDMHIHHVYHRSAHFASLADTVQ